MLVDLGFLGNPFFLEPIPPDREIIRRAFIDREEETGRVKHFVGLPAGRLLLLGIIGEGKSSLLNVAEEFAASNGIMPIHVDGSVSSNLEQIVEMLLHLLQKRLEDFDEKKLSELAKAVKELDVEEVTEEEKAQIEGTVEAGIGALIATLKSKVRGLAESGKK